VEYTAQGVRTNAVGPGSYHLVDGGYSAQ